MTKQQGSTHTPGPWHVDDEHGSLVIRNGGLIADVGPAHKEANARLMAAAPELLAAIRGMLENTWGYDARMEKRKVAQAAVEKAAK